MENTYSLKEKKISKLLDILDSFKTRIDNFNSKYNNCYTYGIDVYKDSEASKGSYIADINIKRNEPNTDTVRVLN